MDREFDFVVVGQGLAGTALAWWLRWTGARVLVIDREESVTSSRVAAGLITPITGQKIAPSWRFGELWPAALSFYERVEQETNSRFFVRRSMLRLFANDAEKATFSRRQTAGEFPVEVRQPIQNWNSDWFQVESDGFEMSDGGQLDVVSYLDASRECFQRTSSYQVCDLDVSRETEIQPEGVRIPALGVRAKGILFCQGISGVTNPWFSDVRFKPAKGEILTLRIPGLTEHRVVYRGIWLAAVGCELFKAGATYDWKSLDNQPTELGRNEIIGQLTEFLRLPFEVVNHQAAVRPIHHNQYPVLGRHPLHPQLGYFNGLGSKGALHAPYFGRQLTLMLINRGPIDPEVDLNLKTDWSSRGDRSHQATNQGDRVFHVKRPGSIPLTQQAQNAVREVVQSGEFTIDATAGNGHDTQFLAELVGAEGHVHAFDIQQLALDNTAKRLADAGLHNVVLWHRDHAELATIVPKEHQGRVAAIMFNLGYLPGGDKQIITQADSSRRGVAQAAQLLRPGGILTVLAYTGHDGGQSEASLVADVLSGLPSSHFDVRTVESQPGRTAGPRLFLVKRH